MLSLKCIGKFSPPHFHHFDVFLLF
jgi:hypothetical protein